MPFSGATHDMDPEFVSKFGAPADDKLLVLPLLLKEKVAALVYADAGVEGGGKLDAAAVELLVLATSAWLEVASLRKQALKEEKKNQPRRLARRQKVRRRRCMRLRPIRILSRRTRQSMLHPFRSRLQLRRLKSNSRSRWPRPSRWSQRGSSRSRSCSRSFANLSPEDADVHRKAHRFARLLVDEIKLYNQVKVSEGRKNKDLYDRLKEDIEKSRATYQKRYGNTAAGGADYFSQELVRSLAEDDTSIMGANFRRN